MASKTGLLLEWAQRHTAGYPGVAVRDFTRSWRSGLAWGALIAHFAPHALDFSTLDQRAATENDPAACRANLTRVFEVAKSLGIPALLDVDDMVDLPVPEKLSVTTYTIGYYNRFGEDGQPRHDAGLRASAPSKLAGPAEAPELGPRRPLERRRLMRTPSTASFLANYGNDSRSPSASPTVPQRTVVTRLGVSPPPSDGTTSSGSSTSSTSTSDSTRGHTGLLVRAASGAPASHGDSTTSTTSTSTSSTGTAAAATAPAAAAPVEGECPRCGKPFGTDELAPVNVAGQQYHLGCFICNTCKKHIDPNSEWKRRGGVFVCERHALRTHTMSSFSLQMPSLPSANASPETPLWKKKLLEERRRKAAEAAAQPPSMTMSLPAARTPSASEDGSEAASASRPSEGDSSSTASDKKEKKEKKEHKHKHHKKDEDAASKDAEEGAAPEAASSESKAAEVPAEVPAEKPAAEPVAKEAPAPAAAAPEPAPAPAAAPAPVVEKPAPEPAPEQAPAAEAPAKSEESSSNKANPYMQGFKTGMGVGTLLGAVLMCAVFTAIHKLGLWGM